MKWLLGLGAAGALTLLIATVDLHPWIDRWSPAESRESALGTAVRHAQARLSEATHIDSLLPLLPAQPGVRVMLAPFVDASVAASIHASAAQQLAELGTPRARAGIFVVPVTLGLHPGLRDRPATRYTYYAGTDDGGAYCFVVASAPRVDSMLVRFVGLRVWRDSMAEPLGPCFYWTRYGAPGARMQQWLRESGYRFAEFRHVQRSASDAQPVRRRIFGLREWSGRSLLAEACLSGDEQACVRALMQHTDVTLRYGQLPADAPAVYERLMYRDVAFGEADHALIAELERAFGPERFGQFWRSNEPVDAAFASAFGVSLGDWVHEWALQYYPEATPMRAAVNLPTLLLSLLAIAALCGAAVSTARRREVS